MWQFLGGIGVRDASYVVNLRAEFNSSIIAAFFEQHAMAFYVVSERGYYHHIAWGMDYELEDIMAKTCGAQIIAPQQLTLSKYHWKLDVIFRRWRPLLKLKDFRFADEPNVLLLVGMAPMALKLLDTLPQWREKCHIVAAYILDVYQIGIDQLKTRPLRKITDKLDHLFVSYEQAMPQIQETTRAPVSLLLQAADALTHGAHGGDRPIDLIGFGRRVTDIHKKLQKAFNYPGSPRLYYHSTFKYRDYPEAEDYIEHRQLFFQLLRRAKISLNYRFTHTSAHLAHGICPLTARWFEAIAAGAVIVGSKPTGPDGLRALDWPDAVIDFPDPANDPVAFVNAILEDHERLARVSKRNYAEALARHDWRHRIRDILTTLKQPIPPLLQKDLEQMRSQSESLGEEACRPVSDTVSS